MVDSLRFAEIPEVVFVRGIPEVEQMGIYLLDTGNRWPHGDATNAAGWRSRVATACHDLPAGVTYDSETATLTYDGSGDGDDTAQCRIASCCAESPAFAVRVLRARYAYGPGANVSHPGIGTDSNATTWATFLKGKTAGTTYENPLVVLLTPGVVNDRLTGWVETDYCYLLGDPRSKPLHAHTPATGTKRLAFVSHRLTYLKNIRLHLISIGVNRNPRAEEQADTYIVNVDQTGDWRTTNDFVSSEAREGVAAPITGPHSVWWIRSTTEKLGNVSYHPCYVHGRPGVTMHINCVTASGARCSAIKTTVRRQTIRNSLLSYRPQGTEDAPKWSDKLLDIVAASDSTIYNNRFVGAYVYSTNSAGRRGIPTDVGLIFLRNRADHLGCDEPAYPDVAWPDQSSMYGNGYAAPAGWTGGPDTYTNPAFWQAVSALPVDDPANPLTFKTFIGFNSFVWEIPPGARAEPSKIVRNDGTYPMWPTQQFATSMIYGTAADGWSERSVVFMGPNEYAGFTGSEIDMQWQSLVVDHHGPGPWLEPQPARPLVSVADFPDWFKV
jgi:hypothetical protein